MTTSIFREQTLPTSNGIFSLGFKNVKDIFKYDDTPYLCVGASGGGKTTIAIDIIFQFAKEATKIYYVSATEAMIGEDAMDLIPHVCRRDPSLETLDAVWHEIVNASSKSKVPPEQLIALLPKLYTKEQLEIIHNEISTYERMLTNEKHNKDSISAWKLETYVRLIMSALELQGNSKLTLEELSIVSNFVSKEQKTILIIDDVSAELTKLKSVKGKVNFNGDMLSKSEAYKSILTDIFTKARHYNCICVVFVHTWDVIDVKNQVKNFIILDNNAASGISLRRSIAKAVIEKVQLCAPIVFKENYKYHFLVIKNSGDVAFVSKADLHTDQTLELDELNMKLIETVEKIVSGNENSENHEEIEESDSETEETSEEDEEED